ncbi:MAG: phage portal protein, partial [Desulfotomaculaceae bacterium]
MTLTEQITADLAANSNMNLIIRDLLQDHYARARRMKELYQEYKGDVPIKGRIMPDPSKINEALANDYRGLIIDQAVGYLFGHPITYTLDKRAYTDEKDYMADHEVIQHFLARNDAEDLDADTGKYASICGYAGRLLYVDREGEERACLVPPWECIFVENESTGDIQAALRYFDVYMKENNATVCRTKVEYYDRKNVAVYLQDGKGHFYEYEPPTPHLFDGVPLIKFSNNTEEQGDFEKIAN